tara:strand:+ start:10120 stop:10971 length:852 start_codon:yes stop_codon:yes gene_type:complete
LLNNFIKIIFEITPFELGSEILIAQFSKFPILGHSIEENHKLEVFFNENQWSKNILTEIAVLKNQSFKINFRIKKIKNENWNKTWESKFNPVLISENCVVRSSSHSTYNFKYEIIINPEMSFGTGHHETTYLCMRELLDMESLVSLEFLDYGCGTGILSILAEKLKAKHIDAIDIDFRTIKNSLENIKINNCKKINLIQGDVSQLNKKKYDIIVCNLEKNIIINYIEKFTKLLKTRGILILSGYLRQDFLEIKNCCEKNNLILQNKKIKNDWILTKFMDNGIS